MFRWIVILSVLALLACGIAAIVLVPGVRLWLTILFVLVVPACVVDSIVLVPAYHFDIVERFGRRTGEIFFEGFNLKLPFIDKVERISTELEPIEVRASFTTGKVDTEADEDKNADKLQVELVGSLQYRPSARVKDIYGRNVFISTSEKIIQGGIGDMIEDLLGGLGGIYQAEDFIGNRQAFDDLINQILKRETPYHLRHKRGDKEPDDLMNGGCGVPNCPYDEARIPREELIRFYNSHWKYLKDEAIQKREEEKEDTQTVYKAEDSESQKWDTSSIEQRYGINIEAFAIKRIDFSDAMKTAFEQKRGAKEREKAFAIKLQMAASAQTQVKGVSGQEALDAADVSLYPDIAKAKKIISVQGNAGVFGGLLAQLSSTGGKS